MQKTVLHAALTPLALTLAAAAPADDTTIELGSSSDAFEIRLVGAGAALWRFSGESELFANGRLFLHRAEGGTFLGAGAGESITTGSSNTAVGSGAMENHSTGDGNTAVGGTAMFIANGGSRNSAFGLGSLGVNSGDDNSAYGYASLLANGLGTRNAAFGASALDANTQGNDNSGFGFAALGANVSGDQNAAFGTSALAANTGSSNAAFGFGALDSNTTGTGNIAVGTDAGANQTTGNDNIYVGNAGVAGETGRIRIGSVQSETFIDGIFGNVAGGGLQVFVNPSNELGTSISSARFKEAVQEIGEDSRVIQALRPVSFRYRQEVGGDGHGREYGLLAEEVAEAAPDLVVLDAQGAPYSVRYHQLTPLLVAEVQRQQRALRAQRAVIEALGERLARLEAER